MHNLRLVNSESVILLSKLRDYKIRFNVNYFARHTDIECNG